MDELRKAREEEGWEPSRINDNDIRHIFLESERRMVKGNRVTIAGLNYVGPVLTKDMVRENTNNLAGLSGQKVDVYYDPEDLGAGAWAIDPRTGKPIYLALEVKVDPFNTEAVAHHIEEKRSSMKAVSGTFRETTAFAGKVLTSPEYKPLIESQAAAKKAIADKTAAADAMTDEEFQSAIGSRIVQEQGERARRQAVYSTPMKRYQAVLDIILSGGELSSHDRLFKADYESRMGEIEKTRWQVYIDFQQNKE
jgi:putative transposase